MHIIIPDVITKIFVVPNGSNIITIPSIRDIVDITTPANQLVFS